MNGWGDERCALELAASLRYQAVGVLAMLSPQRRKSYDALTDALRQRFEPSDLTETHRAALKTRVRKRGEPIMTLAFEIKALAAKAYPRCSQLMLEEFAIDCFADALNDTHVEWAVLQGNPTTVEQAATLAMKYEAFQTARARRKPQLFAVDAPAEGKCVICAGEHDVQHCRWKNRRCFNCGERGHLRRRCPQLQEASSGQGN
jgi:hypothetical protein